ncbi:hypothetical protein HBB16_05570 [Pseudonocardia sp. MCCB 268]|nr:hypothetical protein [Pseudonocardia cytotoxica]
MPFWPVTWASPTPAGPRSPAVVAGAGRLARAHRGRARRRRGGRRAGRRYARRPGGTFDRALSTGAVLGVAGARVRAGDGAGRMFAVTLPLLPATGWGARAGGAAGGSRSRGLLAAPPPSWCGPRRSTPPAGPT